MRDQITVAETCRRYGISRQTFSSKDLYADHGPAGSIEDLLALCDQFRWHYNHQWPHQNLG